MQLRVARLCLDCEELHGDNSCPRCASESYAFLTSWLPSEERRRWRRPAPILKRDQHVWSSGPGGVMRAFGRWLSGEEAPPQFDGPATRAADRAALLNFDGLSDAPSPHGEIEIPMRKAGVPKL